MNKSLDLFFKKYKREKKNIRKKDEEREIERKAEH